MSKHGQNHNEQTAAKVETTREIVEQIRDILLNKSDPFDAMERNDTRTPKELIESAEAVKARLHEQTLRPVEGVAQNIQDMYFENGAIVNIDTWKATLNAFTTDRDAAYTMLKTMIEGKRLPRYKKGAFIEHRNQTNAIYNTAIDHILTLLDTIFNKTHTV